MLKLDEKFLTIIRKNDMRSFYKAHQLLPAVSIPVLEKAANELCSRSDYHFRGGNDKYAEHAIQFANQIEGVLHYYGQNTVALREKIQNSMM
jgi:hypothetical protein